jgi:hypothetical protein
MTAIAWQKNTSEKILWPNPNLSDCRDCISIFSQAQYWRLRLWFDNSPNTENAGISYTFCGCDIIKYPLHIWNKFNDIDNWTSLHQSQVYANMKSWQGYRELDIGDYIYISVVWGIL